MANPIRVTIKGSSAGGTDAPTVDDLIGQIKDIVDVLQGVERAIANGANDLVWRVTNVRMNSPIDMELTPFGRDDAAFIGARALEVEHATLDGLRALRAGNPRPAFFTEEVLPKARRLHARMTNGLSETALTFDPAVSEAPLVLDQETARAVAATEGEAKAAVGVPYRELGSVEGFVAKAELDGHGRPILWFRSRMDNVTLKAIGKGDALRQIEALRLSDVWRGVRLRVYGMIYYKALGQIDHIQATGIEPLDNLALPGLDDIIDPDFTRGLTTEEYLRELRL